MFVSLYASVPLSLPFTKFSHSLNHCMLIHRMTVGASSAWNSLFNYRQRKKRNRERYDHCQQLFKLPLNNLRVSVLFSITVIRCISFWSTHWKPLEFQTWIFPKHVLNLVVHQLHLIRCCCPDKILVKIIFSTQSVFHQFSGFTSSKRFQEHYAPSKRSFCTTLPKMLYILVDNLEEQYSNTLPAYLWFTLSIMVKSHCLLFIVYFLHCLLISWLQKLATY